MFHIVPWFVQIVGIHDNDNPSLVRRVPALSRHGEH